MYLYIVNLVHKHPCHVFYSVPRLTICTYLYIPFITVKCIEKMRCINEGIS